MLKPGGTFHFVEHGLAPDAKVQRVLDTFYEEGAPKFLAADSLGVAVSP